jgi:hypothetical protein
MIAGNAKYVTIVTDIRLGGGERYFLGYPNNWNMDIPDEVLKCVTFVCVEVTNNGQNHYVPGGTGFLVSVPSQESSGVHYIYLVTAKHNIEGIAGNNSAIRVNSKDGKVLDVPITKETRWFEHPNDPNIDVVVTPFYNEEFDMKTIPISMLLRSQDELRERDIGIGDDVFITGLFTRHYGEKRNLPIVRVGNIAMLSDEKVWVSWHDGCAIDAYLIEARSIGGISGSPVFFSKSPLKGGNLNLGKNEFYLGGLIHGHWPVSEDKIDSLFTDNMKDSEERNVNMGIAIVVPAEKILEVLNQEELKKMRNTGDEARKQEISPTTTD